MDSEIAPNSADILLDLIQKEGFSTGEATAFDSRCGLVWIIDATKDGECWVVTAQSRYEGIKELGYVLTPGRYVGLAEEEEDFNFAQRFAILKSEFEE